MIKRLLITLGLRKPDAVIIPRVVPNPAPHEQYPQIMHWQEGDEIRASRFWFRLISITADGWVYGRNVTNEHKFGEPLWMVIRDGSNLSLNDRQINETLKASNDYMELLKHFNAAFAELQERDKRLKLVS